jgi:hypothetical protein
METKEDIRRQQYLEVVNSLYDVVDDVRWMLLAPYDSSFPRDLRYRMMREFRKLCKTIANDSRSTYNLMVDMGVDKIEGLDKEAEPKKGVIYKNKQAYSKETTYLKLDNMVNPNLSVKENIEMIKIEYKFPVSKSTLYNYYKDRGLSTKQNKLSDEELLKILNPDMTIRKSRKFLNDNDIHLSETKLRALLKQKKELSNITKSVR